jgi:hypothetical protein
MTTDRQPGPGVFFATDTGSIFAATDSGENWKEIACHLPKVRFSKRSTCADAAAIRLAHGRVAIPSGASRHARAYLRTRGRESFRSGSMSQHTAHKSPEQSPAAEALRLLDAAWAYYTPGTLYAPADTAFDELPTT